MATYTLARPDVFPNGTSVGAYANDNPNPNGSPQGTAVNSQTMTAGTLTFTGLTEGETYLAAAEVNSVWKNLSFTVDTATTALASDDNVEVTGDWEFSGEVTLSGTVVGTDIIDATAIEAGAVGQSEVAADAVGDSELKLTLEDVTVLAGAATGTATVVAGDKIIGIYPVSNQDQHIDSVAISGTTLTVTLAANATADNVFKVAVINA
jgi:hypothetical protein